MSVVLMKTLVRNMGGQECLTILVLNICKR